MAEIESIEAQIKATRAEIVQIEASIEGIKGQLTAADQHVDALIGQGKGKTIEYQVALNNRDNLQQQKMDLWGKMCHLWEKEDCLREEEFRLLEQQIAKAQEDAAKAREEADMARAKAGLLGKRAFSPYLSPTSISLSLIHTAFSLSSFIPPRSLFIIINVAANRCRNALVVAVLLQFLIQLFVACVGVVDLNKRMCS